MNDTTRWIMIALLLLLIGAAVFVLLRSPGKDGPEDADRADGDRDVPSTGARPAVAPRPERGVYDQAADEPVDQPAGQAAAGATAVAPQDDTRDDTTGGAAAVYDSTLEDRTGGGGTAYDTTPDDTTVHRGGATAYPATAGASEDQPTGSWGGADADVRPQDDHQVSEGRDEPLTADEVVASSDDRARDEHPASSSTTDRAGEGDAVALDGAEAHQDAGSTPGTATAPMADRPVFMESIYGPGSAEPLADGAGPAGWTVKANTGSMLFHTPDSPSYDSVRAEVWFQDEEAARNAGFAHWDRRRR